MTKSVQETMELKNHTSVASLEYIHGDCLLEIIKFLEFDDFINLADCIDIGCVADRAIKGIFKECLEFKPQFKLNRPIIEKGAAYIDRLFSVIGCHVLSLEIDCGVVGCERQCVTNFSFDQRFKTLNWSKIGNDCKNMESLNILHWKDEPENIEYFSNLESLTLRDCKMPILQNVNKLKNLDIQMCPLIGNCELKKASQINSSIESFAYKSGDDLFIDFHLLEMIPKVKKLTLTFKDDACYLNPLLKLNCLTKLTLFNFGKETVNINRFLVELAIKGILQELDLYNIDFDNDFFKKVLKQFGELLLLIVHGGYHRRSNKLPTLITWPPKLKNLKIKNFDVKMNSFLSIIRKANSLENLDIESSHFDYPDNDVMNLSEQILTIMESNQRKQQLNVRVPSMWEGHGAKKIILDSKQLRIERDVFN